MHPMELLGDVGHVESRSVCLEIVLVLVQDRSMVCAKSIIGLDIILDAPDGIMRTFLAFTHLQMQLHLI